MLARATTFALQGVDAVEVAVEADISSGLPAFTIVGLPDAAVQESRERVRAAMVNSGLEFPLRRITVNLAPADLRKAGPGFDLALAAGDPRRPPARSTASASAAASPAASWASTARYGRCAGRWRSPRRPRAAASPRVDRARRNAAEASLIDGIEVAGVASLTRA